jgi:hypothetical protein
MKTFTSFTYTCEAYEGFGERFQTSEFLLKPNALT